MSTRKFIRAVQTTSSHLLRAIRNFTRSLVQWLLRGLLILGKQPAYGRAGFVLPTTVLLIMVVLLTVGSIVFRTYTRTNETISERQQRVVYNAATPAIDRARSKLEFLFDSEREPRYPGGVPSENVLMALMLNGATISGTTIPAFPGGGDPYTFNDETRINVGTSYTGDTSVDNAWRYRADTDGDGTPDATVVYAINMRLDEINQLQVATDARLTNRASNLRVRNTPLSASTQGAPECAGGAAIQPQQGWIPAQSNSSVLYKNFQVDAYVLPDAPGQPISTLEMQMDRQINRGNKWGAWFRNDLEIFPGPGFNWNGAMHTEGSLMVDGGSFTGFMISDPDSCLYTEDASEVTVAIYDAEQDNAGNVVVPPFRGEFISGSMRDDSGSGSRFETGTAARFHLWNGARQLPLRADNQGVTMSAADDSVAPHPGSGPTDYALDPVIMQTVGISQHRNPAVANTARPAAWTNGPKAESRLITPERPVPAPYVDDTFRADNRLGPKPNYGVDDPLTASIGTPISATDTRLLGDEPAPGESTDAVGLDGYWERRARVEGLRLIVGQRLELGDPAGWGGPVLSSIDYTLNPTANLDREALRPFRFCSEVANRNTNNATRCSEARQRRTLWDNLAAVQAMAVYHAGSGDRDRPVACMAATVHPGTDGTLNRSATFENLTGGVSADPAFAAVLAAAFGGYGTATRPIISDFLTGRGTNGWEYEFRTDWNAATYDNASSTLRIALRNLAQYAGDPFGGTPSFIPSQDQWVHPFPAMSMWGDFSVLRRVLRLIEPVSLGGDGATYASLSPADKTTLHTASCMLGMLAYNLDYLARFEPSALPASFMGRAYDTVAQERAARTSSGADLTDYYSGLRGAIRALVNGTSPLGAVEGVTDVNLTDSEDSSTNTDPLYIGAGVNDRGPNSRVNQPETYVRLLERWRDSVPAGGTAITGSSVQPTRNQLNQYIAITQLIINKEQVARDRNWGFYGATQPVARTAALSRDNPAVPTANLAGTYGTAAAPANGCGGMAEGVGVGDSLRYLCSWRPRYPILFSLFPAEGFANRTRTFHGDVDRPVSEEGVQFVRDQLDSAGDSLLYLSRTAINRGVQYQVIPQTQIASDLVAMPRVTTAEWRLPVDSTVANPGRGIPQNRDTLVKVCFNNTTPADQVCLSRSRGLSVTNQSVTGQQFWRVPFKDAALFNGREMMTVRALDVNLDFIRQRGDSLVNDSWLPRSGITYAFREDAVSENSILRPASATWSSCDAETDLRTNPSCQMTIEGRNAFNSLDPPVATTTQITPKPVDYYPDPDRRPNGFRLINGQNVGRTGDEGRGLSFISDNPVYIQGSFNLHSASLANPPIEEFTQTAGANYESFYARTNLNPSFSNPANDPWRPSEVLADAITILSVNFCDGSIEDGITNSFDRNRYNCNNPTSSASSFQNQNRPSTTPTEPSAERPGWRWFRTIAADGMGLDEDNTGGTYQQGDSPIYVSPNGNPWTAIGSLTVNPIYNGNYITFNTGKTLNGTQCNQRVNAIIVSGLVPSRSGNSYGGLHNFPRFIESWGGSCNLFISGSLIQLNFSTYATGLFDQDAWEVGSTPVAPAEWIQYYGPPARRWGYDVGLQYAPAGPVARRFITLQPSRNEFYSEPPADDPYMQRLLASTCASGPVPRPARCP